MRRARRLIGAVCVLSAVLAAGGAVALDQVAGPGVRATAGEPSAVAGVDVAPVSAATARSSVADVDLPRPARGETAVRLLGDEVDEAAALNDLEPDELVDVLRSDPTAWVDDDGRLFYKDPVAPARSRVALTAEAAAPLDQTFALHSKPGSKKTIFLDFDGGSASGTAWHQTYPTTPTTQPAWDPAGDGPTFSSSELTSVQAIWASVAEDYAPFDVDVTTADPGAAAINRSGAGDDVYGTHVLVTPSAAAYAAVCPTGCGGVAYTGSFGSTAGAADDGYGYYQPAWVFPQSLGPNSPKYIAEAASHEAGHTLGLHHDGNATEGYDRGHGSWAPIMGVGYDHPISQWSKGDYTGANNQEDDVAIIRAAAGSRFDNSGPTLAQSDTFPSTTQYITTRTDTDVYLLGTCSGAVSVSANPADGAPDLDIKLTLVTSTGTPVATADPSSAQANATTATGLGATISQNLDPATYYVVVDGTGNGSWSGGGYDDYGSLGAYTMSKTGNCNGLPATGVPSEPTSVAAAPDPATPAVTITWGAPGSAGAGGPVTGYLLSRSGSDEVVQVPASTTSYTWTGLELSTGYTFTVTAMNARGVGALAYVSTTTTNGVVKPGAVQGLTGGWDSLAQRMPLSWTPPASAGSSALTAYAVYLDGYYLGAVDATYRGVSLTGLSPGTHSAGVAAVNASGTGPQSTVSVSVPARPANDAFAARTALAGTSGTVAGDNLESSAEPGDPAPPATRSGAGAASLWYSWTAPGNGSVTLATASAVTGRDTTLAVYTGSALGALSQVAGNDEPASGGHLASLTFTATAGTTYAIAVDGYRGFAAGVGPFGLSWSLAETGQTATSTSLSATLSGRTATLSSRVTTATRAPVGRVQFTLEGSVVLGYADVAADGTATFTAADLEAGQQAFQARFVPTDATLFAESTSPSRLLTVVRTPTTTTLQASVDQQTVALEATVTLGEGTAAGVVEFREDGALVRSVQVSAGRAATSLTDEAPGQHSYTATFRPTQTTRYASSTSGTASVTVPERTSGRPTTTTLDGRVDGRTIYLTVTVAADAGTPVGSVEILDNGTSVGTQPLSGGSALVALTDLTRGTHRITAVYVPADPLQHASSTSAEAAYAVAATPTTVGLTAALSGSVVTLDALVGSSTPGQVEFRDDGTLVGTVVVSGRVARLVVDGIAAGDHHYTATFVPADGERYSSSTSESRTVTVTLTATAVDLGTSVRYHRVTLVATVTSADDRVGGTVTFKEGTTVVGTAQVLGGVAQVVVTDVATGDHAYVATYVPTDTQTHAGAVSPVRTATVVPTPTTTDLAVGVAGRTVTLGATVSTADGAPAGSVELREGTTLLGSQPVVDGTATLTVVDVAPGAHGYTATFVPDGSTHAGSTSPTRTGKVRADTATTLAASVDGQTVTLEATVTGPGDPAGTVEVRDGGTLVGSRPLGSGSASLVLTGVAPGEHSYVATFVATDSALYATSLSAAQAVTVARVATTTTLAVAVDGRAVTLTATVATTWGTPTGTVEFRDGDTLVGQRQVSGGTATTTISAAAFGAHRYTATFVPSGSVHSSSASDPEPVTVLGTTTTSLDVTVTGRTVVLTATVGSDGTAPAGTVTFYRNGFPVSGVPVVDGTATLTQTNVAPGTYSWTASFRPTSAAASSESSSPAVPVVVSLVTTTTSLEAAVSDRTVTLDATVASADGNVAGQVQFRDGTTLVGSQAVSSGSAVRLTLTSVLPGDHVYTATYVPSANTYAGSTSAGRTLTVARIGTATDLTASATGDTVNLAATTTVASSGGSLAGSVEFREGDALVGTAPLGAGARTTLTLRSVWPGPHTYTATFVPSSSTHAGSTSAGRTATVAAITTTTSLAVAAAGRAVHADVVVTAARGVAAGQVVIRESGSVVATVPLVDGAASLDIAAAPPGSRFYAATFVPTDPVTFAGSVSPTRNVVVDPIPTTTDLTAAFTGSQTVSLSAAVSAPDGAPAGVVVFREGTTEVGTISVVAGVALATLRSVQPGAHTYRATFVPASPATYAGSESPARTASVDPIATRTGLTGAATGSTVRLTASVDAPGQVVFQEGSTEVGTVTVASRSAVLSLTEVPAGSHTYTATFVPADPATYAGSVSPETAVVVKVATTTSLTATATGRTVSLGATIAGTGAPAGRVVFAEGGTSLGTVDVADGAAALVVPGATPGRHTYTATFVPSSPDTIAGSTSEPAAVTVDPFATTTTFGAEAEGRSVALTAHVSGAEGGTPAGRIVFREGATAVATVALAAGTAAATIDAVTPGPHAYSATFEPTDPVTFAVSTASRTVTVAAVPTTTSLTVRADGRSVTLAVTVDSGYAVPAGDVVIREGATELRTLELVAGTAAVTLAGVSPGTHDYTATYLPRDPTTHTGSTSEASSVTVGALSTTTELGAEVDVRTVTLTARVVAEAGTAAGRIEIREGDEVVGAGDLEEGAATVTLDLVHPGEHTYTATFVADDPTTYGGSTSAERTVTVAPVVTDTALDAEVDVRTVTLTVGVTGASGSPAGYVEIREGGEVVASDYLHDGSATVILELVRPGEHTYTATFVADDPATYGGSTSDERTVTVAPVLTATTVDAQVDVRTVTLTATVTGASGSPAGRVEVREGNEVVGSGDLEEGSATVTLDLVRPGEHTYTATFVADDPATYAASTSDGRTVTVAPIVTTTELVPTADGRQVTLAVAVTGASGSPTGRVVLREGVDELETLTLDDGAAMLVLDDLEPGDHTYSAAYLPTDPGTYAASASGDRTVHVGELATTTTLTGTVDERTVRLSAAVTATSGDPVGEVSFTDSDGAQLGTVPLAEGHASVTVRGVVPATRTYYATFTPSGGRYAGSVGEHELTVTSAPLRTTTSLSAVVEGRAVTLHSEVTSSEGPPDGQIEFLDGDQVIVSWPLWDGSTEWEITLATKGVHDYHARFVPADPTSFAPSVAPAASVLVTGTPTSTSLTADVADGTVTLAAAVTAAGGTPYGSLTFFEGDRQLESYWAADGTATHTVTGVLGGRHDYRVVFAPVQDAYDGSSAVVSATVAATATTTSLTAVPSGRDVRLSASVAAPVGSPAGTVVFRDGPVVVATDVVHDGAAAATLRGVATGDHSYTATYVPADPAHHAGSSSEARPLALAPSTTRTTATVTSSGTSVVVSATVTSSDGTPDGIVEVREGDEGDDEVVGTGEVVQGAASVLLPGVTVGRHVYVVTFVPADDTYAGSSAAPHAVEVTDVPPAAVTGTDLSVDVTRRTVTLTASVSPRAAGTVVFSQDGADLPAVEVGDGQAVWVQRAVTAGQHRYAARFVPDDASAFEPSASPERQVSVAPTVTTTTLSGRLSGASANLGVVVGASDGIVPAGTVQVREGTRLVGTVQLTGGRGTLVVAGLGVGSHAYRATYVSSSGDVAGSTSATVTLRVPPVATRTLVTAPKTAKKGSRPVVTVRVSAGSAAAAGPVTLKAGATTVRLTLRGGAATYKLPKLKKGTLKITATYAATTTSTASSASATIKVR